MHSQLHTAKCKWPVRKLVGSNAFICVSINSASTNRTEPEGNSQLRAETQGTRVIHYKTGNADIHRFLWAPWQGIRKAQVESGRVLRKFERPFGASQEPKSCNNFLRNKHERILCERILLFCPRAIIFPEPRNYLEKASKRGLRFKFRCLIFYFKSE